MVRKSRREHGAHRALSFLSSYRRHTPHSALLCACCGGCGWGLCPQGWSGGTRHQAIPLSNSGVQDQRAHRPPRRGHAPQHALGQALRGCTSLLFALHCVSVHNLENGGKCVICWGLETSTPLDGRPDQSELGFLSVE